MLEALLGNKVIEKILLFLSVYGSGYPRQMSGVFDIPVNGIQQQLKRLENGSVVVSRKRGKVRIYSLNPAYPFLDELNQLLEKTIKLLPDNEVRKYYRKRTRPRRKGK